MGMAAKEWADVRSKHVAAAGPGEVAEAMGVSTGRVSRIEHGDLSGLDVLDRYVQALGGQFGLVATFGDEQLKVGSPLG
jgi:transcriptional regulator with XRE-family HTH domain